MRFLRSALVALGAAALTTGGAMAADLPQASAQPYQAPTTSYQPSGFNWDGPYAGVYGGAEWGSGTHAALGGIVGLTTTLSPGILGSIEAQGGYVGNSSNHLEGYVLGHLGAALSDNAQVYAAAGVGTRDSDAAYAFGGGLEFAASSNMSVRGEVLGVGQWGDSIDTGRATVGLLWHY